MVLLAEESFNLVAIVGRWARSLPEEEGNDAEDADEGDGTTFTAVVTLEDVLAVLGVLCFAAKLWSRAGMELSRCCW